MTDENTMTGGKNGRIRINGIWRDVRDVRIPELIQLPIEVEVLPTEICLNGTMTVSEADAETMREWAAELERAATVQRLRGLGRRRSQLRSR